MNDARREGGPSGSGPVLFYTDAVIDHFTNPRNVGELDEADTDAFARIGDPGCGDEMMLWLRIRDGRIDKVRFRSFGCPGAISTGSMLTVLADGRTVEDAGKISDDDVVDALGGIPENKKHCSLLGVKALRTALEGYGQAKMVR